MPGDSRSTLYAESEVGSVNSKFELSDPQSGSVSGDLGERLRGSVNGGQPSPNIIVRTETGNIGITPLR